MRNFAFAALAITFLFSSCKEGSFQKGEQGMEYKIIKSGKGETIKNGEFMFFHIKQSYNNGTKDSVMQDSRETVGIFEKLDSTTTPPAYFKLLSQMRKGDSMVIRILTDSVFNATTGQEMPPFFQKGKHLMTTVKMIDIYKTMESADSARQKEFELAQKRMEEKAKAQIVVDDKILQEHFKKNNITVQKAPEGTYVQIIEPGTGNLLDSTTVPLVNYTGRTLSGVMFDSNTDPSKGHVEPLLVNMPHDPAIGSTSLIKGWLDGLTLLRKNSKAKFYIPSSLAYGPQPMGNEIKANEILVFDIDVVDVLNKQQAVAKAQDQMMKMRELQKKFMDSIQKANPQMMQQQGGAPGQ